MNIDSFVKKIEKQHLNCEGIVVYQHGKKAAGHRWIPEAPRNVYSVSKSFTSVAIGMAIQRGKLSLDKRPVDYFPGVIRNQGRRLQSLSLEHLLAMTRGHARFSRPATAGEALSQKLKYEPGSRFVYDNGSTLLASAMFTRAMGMTVLDFLAEALFAPLEIPAPEWPQSADGHTMGATGLRLTTESLALFGLLLLQRGEWRGKQLLPPGWIDCASRAHVSTRDSRRPDYDLGYGYGFWPCRHGAYRADGKDGQFVIVLPSEDAVIAVNSSEKKMAAILYAVWDEILPLLRG
ncbi:MAG: beta-lactamase family protein [Treponema sp.]|jgi:CubicO group peptidase (beta-lactamase class C family)|nr:beta-lactamase family protein [Treponema sp.]